MTTSSSLPRRTRLRRAPAALPHPQRGAVRRATQMIIAGTLAWWVCTALGASRPLFAVLVPLVSIGSDPFGAVNISLDRMLGVFAGVIIGLALLALHLPSTALVALLLTVCLLGGLALRVGGALNNQIAISAMFMLYLGVGGTAQAVGVDRIWETAVGAVVAIVVSAVLWPPDPLAEARKRGARLQAWLDDDLQRVADLLARPEQADADRELQQVRRRSLQAVQELLAVDREERALRFNLRHRRDADALKAQRQRLAAAARQYRHVRALARMAADAVQPPLPVGERALLAGSLGAQPAGPEPDPQATRAEATMIDARRLHDPRSVAIVVRLEQMRRDRAEGPRA